MKIQSISQTNFRGGFRIKNITPEAKAKLPDICAKGKQIFEDFGNNKDVFVVCRDKYDYKFARLITDDKLEFEYYPLINTKCGLDCEEPSKLEELIASQKEAPITSKTGLKNAIKKRSRIENLELKSQTYVGNILKSLCIDNKHQIINKKGASIVIDKEFNRDIHISPPSKHNIHYVAVRPKSIGLSTERYAIDSNGNILAKYTTPDGMRYFNQRFNELLVK